MQTGIHALGLGAQWTGIVVGAIVLTVVLAYVVLIFAIVVGQAASALGI